MRASGVIVLSIRHTSTPTQMQCGSKLAVSTNVRDDVGAEKRRINTQMPRRTKVRPSTPMASEWDISAGAPPNDLRTPADKMMPRGANGRSPVNVSLPPQNDGSSRRS